MKNGRCAPAKTDPWKAAEAYGCDTALLEANLRRSPAERVRRHSRALATALALRQAMERRRVKP